MKIIIEEEGPNQFKVLYAKICKDYAQLKVLKVLTVIKWLPHLLKSAYSPQIINKRTEIW